MNLPVFSTPLDGELSKLALAYAPGAGVLALVDALRLTAATPSTASPVRLQVVSTDGESTSEFLCVQQPSGNIVNVALVSGYEDVGFPVGSSVGVPWSAGAALEVQDAILSVVEVVSTLSTADIAGLGSAATRPASDFLSPTGSGAGLTSLNGSAISTGTVPAARLGAGSPSSSTFLRGDGQWSSPPPAPVLSVAGRTGTVSLSTADVSGLATVASTGAYVDLTGRPTLGSLAALNGIGGLLSAGTGIALSGGGGTGSPVLISATGGGGSASPGGSTGQIQVNNRGSFGGSAALATASTNPLVVTLDNTDYNSVNGSNSLIKLNNPNPEGQNVVASVINGVVVAKWRTDYEGSVNWIADGPKGGHHFFVGGDYGIGTDALMILRSADVIVQCTTNSGFVVQADGYQLRDLVQFRDGTDAKNVIASISSRGEYRPPGLLDYQASAGSLFYSATAGKLAYKDPSGTVHYLY